LIKMIKKQPWIHEVFIHGRFKGNACCCSGS
jgi:hypothetical protein